MLKSFQHFVEEQSLCSPHHKILLAISGGIDSVCMLHLFNESAFEFGIAHCNFKLRGGESEKDEKFVKSLAEKFKVKSHFKSFDTSLFAEEKGLSIQEAARELRYRWFEELSKQYGYDRIAVAHHLGDQIETFFINLFRGSGVHGLKGMPLKRDRIIRPLLFARRKEIELYVAQHQLEYREDSSNASDKYLRNKIRHRILPDLVEMGIDYEQGLFSSLDHLSDDSRILKQFLDEKRKSLFIDEGVRVKVAAAELLKLNPFESLLYYLLSPFQFNRQTTDQLSISLKNSAIGKIFESPTHKLLLDREHIIIEKIGELDQIDEQLIESINKNLTTPFGLRFTLHSNFECSKIVKSKNLAYFDYSKLKFPLTLRAWKHGDNFRPFGMRGSQLVSDYLIDHKIDRFEKEKVFVLLSEGKIIWLIGHRTSENFRITEKTTKVLVIECQLSPFQ